jgi:hypothetical protein
VFESAEISLEIVEMCVFMSGKKNTSHLTFLCLSNMFEFLVCCKL